MGILTSKRLVLALAVTGVVGLLLLIAAHRLARPELVGPGLILFAIGIVTAGAHAVVERYLYERSSVTPARQTFTGPAAVLSGVALMILGISIGVAGVAFLLEAEHALYDFLVARPGFALLAVGLASAAWGGARLLGAREWRGSVARVLANVPERMGGVILLILGAALVGLGGFELAAPDAFDRALADLLGQARTAAQ